MEGRTEFIGKVPFSWHGDSPICWLVREEDDYIDWGSVYYWELDITFHYITLQLTLHWLELGVLLGTWPPTKLPNQIWSNHNQPNQRNFGKVIVSDLMPKDSIFSFHAQDLIFCLRKMTIDGRPRMTNQCQHLSLITRIVFVLCITKIYPRTLWPQPGGKRWMEDLSI